MITWIGLLGKILSFVAEKLATKAFDGLGNKKAVAAESLIRIYTAVAELEGLVFEILLSAKHSIEHGHSGVFVSAISIAEGGVEAQTRNLIDPLIRISPVLEFFDPDLLDTVECICAWKYNILYEASRSMLLEREAGGHQLVRLRFKDPSDRILELDMESHYQWVQTNPDYVKWKKDIRLWIDDLELKPPNAPFGENWENLEWPQTLLIGRRIEEVFEDSEIDPNVSEMSIIGEFAEKLGKHLKLLSTAREKLKVLIREKLSIEDVLYVSSKIKS